MAASPAQIAANRANAMNSSGPKTKAGKDAARRNALKHGMTGAGVVIPGEDEHEVASRVAFLAPELAPDASPAASLLLRQVAIASIRAERAFRHESALAAERVRRAADRYDDERQAKAQEILSELAIDPVTVHRRLLTAPEGVDALLVRLRALLLKAEPQNFVAWDAEEGTELDLCLGNKPGQVPLSRAALLTRAVVYDHWVGLDPADFDALSPEGRLVWAVGEVRSLIVAEIATLEAHRATLDTTPIMQSRSEAGERSLLDLKTEGTAIRRYASAAERSLITLLKELRLMRFEAQLPTHEPAAARTVVEAMITEMPALKEVRDELGPFCSTPTPTPARATKQRVDKILSDLKSSYVPITVGRKPQKPKPSGS